VKLQTAVQIAQVAAVFAATAAASLAAFQLLLSRRTAALQVLQSFDKAATEREAAIMAASDAAKRTYAFNEYMNFLELYAAFCNRHGLAGSLLTGFGRRFVRNRLLDSVVVIERAVPETHEAIKKAIFQPGTFNELYVFVKRNKSRLKKRRIVAEAHANAASSTSG
jgi:hypothetical protein